jgi:hypothetical protein
MFKYSPYTIMPPYQIWNFFVEYHTSLIIRFLNINLIFNIKYPSSFSPYYQSLIIILYGYSNICKTWERYGSFLKRAFFFVNLCLVLLQWWCDATTTTKAYVLYKSLNLKLWTFKLVLFCFMLFLSMLHVIQPTYVKSMLNYVIIFLVVIWWLILLLWASLIIVVVIAILC